MLSRIEGRLFSIDACRLLKLKGTVWVLNCVQGRLLEQGSDDNRWSVEPQKINALSGHECKQ